MMSLYLRKAQQSDINILYEWANDSEVRNNAFNSRHISYKDHVSWFNSMMNSENQAQYIFMSGDKAIGQIRLSINGDEAEIDYSVAKSIRGQGYGRELIRLIIQCTARDFPGVKRLVGKVKPSNTASYYCFESSGFAEKYRCLEYEIDKGAR